MRIISVRIAPVARVLAIAYAVIGLVSFLMFAFRNAKALTLPLGIVLPLFHWNFSVTLARRDDLIYNVFLCGFAIASYALTGWITGIATALCFNFVAGKTGGLDAKYFSVAPGESRAASVASPVEAPVK